MRSKLLRLLIAIVIICAVVFVAKGNTAQILAIRLLAAVGVLNDYKSAIHLGELYSEEGNHRKVVEVLRPLVFSDFRLSDLERDLPEDSYANKIKLVPNVDSFLLLAKAYRELGQNNEAELVLMEGSKLNLYPNPIYIELETLLMAEKRFKNAREFYASIPWMINNRAIYNYEVGTTYYLEKKFYEAIDCFDITAALEPKFSHPYKPNIYLLGAISRKKVYGKDAAVNYIVQSIKDGNLNRNDYYNSNFLDDLKKEVNARLEE